MINAQLKNILYRYANTKGVGIPLTAEEMLNAISSWLVDTLPECIDVEITTLAPNATPTITLTGTGTPDDHYILTIGIPESNAITGVEITADGELEFTFADGTTQTTERLMPTLTIGEVSTGDEGSEASAEITGDYPAYELDLTIPRGATGATGATPDITVTASVGNTVGTPDVQVTKGGTDENPTFLFAFSNLKGEQGETGEAGADGQDAEIPNFTISVQTLEAGASATAEIIGTYPNLEIVLGIPRGATGADGQDAENPNISVSIQTLAAGESATAEITGDYPDLTLALGIPRGDTGATGEAGQDGATGATPDITVTASVDNTVGVPSVEVTKGGTAENPTFEFAFSNLKGETGETGEAGADGQNAENPNFSITVEMLEAGTEPTAEVTGDYPDLNIALGIPRGSGAYLYMHVINLTVTTDALRIVQILNNSEEAFTYSSLASWLYENGFTAAPDGEGNYGYPLVGAAYYTSDIALDTPIAIYSADGETISLRRVSYFTESNSFSLNDIDLSSGYFGGDKVLPINA